VPCSSCGRSAAQRRHPPHPAQCPGGWLPVSRVAQPAVRAQGSAAAATCATAELVRDTDVAYPACRSRRALVESGLVESASGSLARAAATAGAAVAARWRKDPRAGMGALAPVDSKWESRLWSSEAMAALPAVDARRPRAARSYRAICAMAARHLGHRPLAGARRRRPAPWSSARQRRPEHRSVRAGEAAGVRRRVAAQAVARAAEQAGAGERAALGTVGGSSAVCAPRWKSLAAARASRIWRLRMRVTVAFMQVATAARARRRWAGRGSGRPWATHLRNTRCSVWRRTSLRAASKQAR
jgi:hypothetical protein